MGVLIHRCRRAINPTDRRPAACTQQGGVMRKVCLSQSLACVTPYPDAGKVCTDNSQCKGGCFSEVVKGKVSSGFCRD